MLTGLIHPSVELRRIRMKARPVDSSSSALAEDRRHYLRLFVEPKASRAAGTPLKDFPIFLDGVRL
jgi:hypothetical protein